jgi:hypothetical protein
MWHALRRTPISSHVWSAKATSSHWTGTIWRSVIRLNFTWSWWMIQVSCGESVCGVIHFAISFNSRARTNLVSDMGRPLRAHFRPCQFGRCGGNLWLSGMTLPFFIFFCCYYIILLFCEFVHFWVVRYADVYLVLLLCQCHLVFLSLTL